MSSDTSKFHEAKQAAAVLKHAVLDRYVTPFASKTGSTSKDGRVAFIDGYAGPGRYADGAAIFNEGVAIARETADKQTEMTNRTNIAEIYVYMGRSAEAPRPPRPRSA